MIEVDLMMIENDGTVDIVTVEMPHSPRVGDFVHDPSAGHKRIYRMVEIHHGFNDLAGDGLRTTRLIAVVKEEKSSWFPTALSKGMRR